MIGGGDSVIALLTVCSEVAGIPMISGGVGEEGSKEDGEELDG